MFLYFIYAIIIFAILLLICTFSDSNYCKTKTEIEYEKNLKKSLEDEFIIDPETGIKLTLEEAETGIWKTQHKENRIIPRLEIEELAFKEEKQVEIALNYFRIKRM